MNAISCVITSTRIKYFWINKEGTLNNTKHCWKKLKAQMNGNIIYVHGLEEDSILLRCYSYMCQPSKSTKSPSKIQEYYFGNRRKSSPIFLESQKIQNFKQK